MSPSRHIALLLALLLAPAAAFAGSADEACAGCHGKDGASTESDVPVIGGLSEQYLVDAMAAYRDRQRPCPDSKYRAGDTRRAKTSMCEIAAKLGAEGAATAAKDLAAAPFVRARQPFDAAKAAAGRKVHEQSCEKCHAAGGSDAADDAGILAGQWQPYLRASFAEFGKGARPMPEKMKPKFTALKPDELEALLHFYASQQ
jgi:sulfide dehydrogenase cytochrome subunit